MTIVILLWDNSTDDATIRLA